LQNDIDQGRGDPVLLPWTDDDELDFGQFRQVT
jgi:hypothetical protein